MRGSRGTPTLKNPKKNMGFLSNTGPDPLKITKLLSLHSMLGHHRHTSETPFKWRLPGGRWWAAYSGIWILPPLTNYKNVVKLNLSGSAHAKVLEIKLSLKIFYGHVYPTNIRPCWHVQHGKGLNFGLSLSWIFAAHWCNKYWPICFVDVVLLLATNMSCIFNFTLLLIGRSYCSKTVFLKTRHSYKPNYGTKIKTHTNMGKLS